jgi:hypothetical protein
VEEMKKKLFAIIVAIATVYGAIASAEPATEHCYFSIVGYETTIFDGPCNETIAEIDANFDTRYDQLHFVQQISSGEEYFGYILEEKKSYSPVVYFDPSYYSVYWNGGGSNNAQHFLGLGMMSKGKPSCINSTEIASSSGEMRKNPQEFQLCWSDLSENDYSPKLLELIAETRSECTEAGGKLTIGFKAVTKIDISGNSNSDEILSYSDLICSDNHSMFYGGSGGEWYSWVIGNNHGKFLTRGWSVDYADKMQPKLTLSLHGTSCGGVGATPCEKSYMWNTDASKLEEVISPRQAKSTELIKD